MLWRRNTSMVTRYSQIKEKTLPSGNNILLHEEKTKYQVIRLYKNGKDYWMSLNGELQFHTKECYKSHQYMCKVPLLLLNRSPKDVLVIGGGDGLPTQELLKHISKFTQVELDGQLIKFTQSHPIMRCVSNDSFNNRKVNLIAGDGLDYLIKSKKSYDLIIDDCDFSVSDQPGLKGPGSDTNKKYQQYRQCLISKLKPGGIAVFMEAMYWPWRDAFKDTPKALHKVFERYKQWQHGPLNPREKKAWMEKTAKEDLEDWEFAPYAKGIVVPLPVIGPEHYIYMSNQPLQFDRLR